MNFMKDGLPKATAASALREGLTYIPGTMAAMT